LFQVPTRHFENFVVGEEVGQEQLAEQVELLLADIQKKYNEHGVSEKPTVFIKNNSGTYGLGVLSATSGDEVRHWNYKSKKKMKATKGGGGFSELVLQEGVPTILSEEGATAEPVLYMLGQELAGGFLRTHEKKNATESLNSPGAVYKRLCLSDLKVSAEGCLLENVYGWVAKLGFLAISREAQDLH
jgi:glutamate--cysteine ligase